mmetsp:Transcript_19256/g.49004  ORF Transcript_19256/g.49004 Transcript_19256/m.49004 type:complete len:215 (+) Transcript_19256:2240-2884(+)
MSEDGCGCTAADWEEPSGLSSRAAPVSATVERPEEDRMDPHRNASQLVDWRCWLLWFVSLSHWPSSEPEKASPLRAAPPTELPRDASAVSRAPGRPCRLATSFAFALATACCARSRSFSFFRFCVSSCLALDTSAGSRAAASAASTALSSLATSEPTMASLSAAATARFWCDDMEKGVDSPAAPPDPPAAPTLVTAAAGSAVELPAPSDALLLA